MPDGHVLLKAEHDMFVLVAIVEAVGAAEKVPAGHGEHVRSVFVIAGAE